MFRSKPVLPFSLLIIFVTTVEPQCPMTCDLALASYNVWNGATLTFISNVVFAQSINYTLMYNPQITNASFILPDSRINVPIPCGCIRGEFLGHVFHYTVQSGDNYDVIAKTYYANLTTTAWLEQFNDYGLGSIPANAVVNVTVNCSCGNATVSRAYGLFMTYPVTDEDSLESIAATENINETMLKLYNPGVDFSAGSGLVYIPGKDASGNYPPLTSGTGFLANFATGAGPSLAPIPDEIENSPPLKSGTGLSGGAIAGIAIGVVLMGALLVAVCIKWGFYRKKKVPDEFSSLKRDEEQSLRSGKDGESQPPNQPQGASDGDKNANTGGGVSTRDVSIGNNNITINLGNMNTGGG